MWNRIRRWIKYFLAEAYSWLRWIWHYHAPLWISWPFDSALIRAIYFLTLIALFTPFIPYAPLQDFLGQAVFDLWKKSIGETSSVGLDKLIASIRSEWILPLLVILVAWGMLVLLWARPRQQFYKGIRETGIIALRGPGERLAFLNRLRKEAISGIGLGPAAKLLATYIPRKEDSLLRERMHSLQSTGDGFGLLITGQPIAGKTRTAMELIFSLHPSIVLVWPRGIETKSLTTFNKWRDSAIVFADNLTLSQTGGDIPLPATLLRLLQDCPHLLLVGTIRKEYLPEDHRGLEAIELSSGDVLPDQPPMQALAEELAVVETANRKILIEKEEILRRYNGHPAGLVAGLNAMRELYEELEAEPRSVLQAARLIWEMGIRELTNERVWEAASLIGGTEFASTKQQMLVKQLIREGFISLHKNGKEWVEIYESYLDEVVTMPPNQVAMEKMITELWKKREDSEAFFERGNAYTDEYSLYFQQDPQHFLLLGISAFSEALRYRTPERAPLQYAATQNNLGNAYKILAAHQDPAENLQRAIQAYGEALRYRTPERAPLDYAMTQNNLGTAYGDLAAHQDPAKNLQRAIQAYGEALRYRTPERTSLQYAMTQNNLGVAYCALAAHQDPDENLQRAIQAYGEALRYRTPERTPLDYAMTQNNLGTAYGDLAAHQDPAENLQRAIQAYGEALRFYTPEERAPLNYAGTQNNLGTAYGDLAAHQDPAKNLQRAIQAYGEALRYRTPERAPLDYAGTQNNLGLAYGDLAAHQDPDENLQRAIQAYGEALRYRTPERAPLDYAMTQNNLGNAYGDLSAHQDPAENLHRAIQAYGEALRFYTPERAPLDYAMTQNNLGNAYRALAAHQDPAKNLQRAIQAYGEALRYRTPERAPLQYAVTQNNLGTAYGDLAAHQDPAENLQRAIQAYGEALRYRTPERAPLDYAMTQNNLGYAYHKLVAHEEEKKRACSYLEKALKAYEEALRYITPENHSQKYRIIVANQTATKEKMQAIGC
jgi:tetratricopeptide (TPR) repeat protein